MPIVFPEMTFRAPATVPPIMWLLLIILIPATEPPRARSAGDVSADVVTLHSGCCAGVVDDPGQRFQKLPFAEMMFRASGTVPPINAFSPATTPLPVLPKAKVPVISVPM